MTVGAKLNTKNQFPGQTLTLTVIEKGTACCDMPTPGDTFKDIAYDGASSFNALQDNRTCHVDGTFILDVTSSGDSLGQQGFSIDQGGNISFLGGFKPSFGSALFRDPTDSMTFIWLIFPPPE
jgi:hypothetical protein